MVSARIFSKSSNQTCSGCQCYIVAEKFLRHLLTYPIPVGLQSTDICVPFSTLKIQKGMDTPDRIVVYATYENSLEASLAKSKLDAYGIPCFLTDEHMAGLYPIHNTRLSVRLHLFEKDREQAQAVLTETGIG